jgi:putative ABC transport system substrate-binding protein
MGFGDDPVGWGWAASLQRPGGQVTGVAMQAHEADLKRLQLTRELLPGLKRLGVLMGPTQRPEHRRMLQATAERLGLALDIAEAARPEDFDRAFAALRQARSEALLVTAAPVYLASVKDIVGRAQASGWPTVCEWQEMARAGCLASFGPVIGELRTRVGAIVAQVLRGVRPADIPIEQPTRFELTLNQKSARALGVTIPQALRLRADEVVE